MTQWVGDPLNSSCRRYAVLKRRQQECGSALIEFVILVPLLIMLLLVIADFGRVTSWAQQVAYSADAGAQYAYQIYSQADIPISWSCSDDATCDLTNIPPTPVCTCIRDRVSSAFPSLVLDSIEVDPIWRCRLVDYDSANQEITVRYSSASVSGASHNCSNEDCGGVSCMVDPVLFIEVTVTDSFKPFSRFIDDVLPASLTNFSATSRRQIF